MLDYIKIISRVGNVAIIIGVVGFILQITVPVVSPHMLLIAVFTIVATTIEFICGSDQKRA